jgi:CHAD domain-containing protein
LRWLADTLGPARNLDVVETGLLKPAQRHVAAPRPLKQLREAVRCRRRAACDDAAEAVRSLRYTSLIRCLSGWFQSCGWRESGGSASLRQPIREVAERVLQRRWRVVKKRGKALAAQSPDQRHRLRIALKKLRYTAELLASLYSPEDAEAFAKELKHLQDDLGRANDLRVAHQILAELAPPGEADPIAEAGQHVLAWHAERLANSEPKLRKHLDELFAAEPFWRE